MIPTIIDCCLDKDIFGRLYPHPQTYANWFTLFRCIYGLKLSPPEVEVYRRFTGRQDDGPISKAEGVGLIIGRKGGKSKAVATITAYEILFSSHWKIGRGIGDLFVIQQMGDGLLGAERSQLFDFRRRSAKPGTVQQMRRLGEGPLIFRQRT